MPDFWIVWFDIRNNLDEIISLNFYSQDMCSHIIFHNEKK